MQREADARFGTTNADRLNVPVTLIMVARELAKDYVCPVSARTADPEAVS